MLNCSRRRQSSSSVASRGFSLLEAIFALVLASAIMMPVVGVLRSSVEIWRSADSRQGRTAHLYGTLRHIQKNIRESKGITSIGSNNGVVLACRDSAGQVCQWTFDRRSGRVLFDAGGGTGPVSEHIREMKCDGFDQDGRVTSILSDIRTVRCTVSVELGVNAHEIKTSHCWISLRS